jgi:hypothetical protein
MSDASQQGPLGPYAAGGVPPAQMSVTRNGDALTASATVPVSLRAIVPRVITILVVLWFVSVGWRTFTDLGSNPGALIVPLLWFLVFSATALGGVWGLAMAISGRVTVTFDRSQITFLQEALGMRRTRNVGLGTITEIGVKTGRLPGSAAQQARFDGVMGNNRPGSYLSLRRGLGTVALFPGMPQSDLFSLLGQVRAHYAMLGVDLPFTDEEPAEAGAVAAAIGQGRQTPGPRPPMSVGDDADRGFWDQVGDAIGQASAQPTMAASPRYAPTAPPSVATAPPGAASAPPRVATAPPRVASGPPQSPSGPPPVAVTGWRPARRRSGFGSPPGTPPLSDKPVYDPEEPPR